MSGKNPGPGGVPAADPQDAEFGRKAKDKEERLDEEMSRGGFPADEPPDERPRAGGKAETADDSSDVEPGRE